MKLEPALIEAMDADSGVVVLLSLELVILRLNRQWDIQAARDGASAGIAPEQMLGRQYLDFVVGPQREQLEQAFREAAALPRWTDSIWLHGECNTPMLRRLLTTRISPLWTGEVRPLRGYLVHHELRVTGALGSHYPLTVVNPDDLREPDGRLVQCSCCRRVREPHSGRWVMSVALLERSDPRTSHGLCALCLETYYPA